MATKRKKKPGRKKAGQLMDKDVRIKMYPHDKLRYVAYAAANGYGHVSAWFRDCAEQRIAELIAQGRIPSQPYQGEPAPALKQGKN